MKKRIFLVIMFCLIFTLASFGAERNLFVDSEESFEGSVFEYDKGVLTNGMKGTGSVYISVPGLSKNYTFKGHVKIVEIGEQAWNGIRVIIGSDVFSASKFVITKIWDTRVEFKMDNLNDLMGPSPVLQEGTEFDFEVVRTGQHYVFTINSNLCLEGDLDIDLDAFDEENDFNLGFEASDCHYEVSNIEIYCADVPETTDTPEPTATLEPTATKEPKPSATTEVLPKDKDEKDGINPLVIIISVLALVAIVVVAIVVIKDKKKK